MTSITPDTNVLVRLLVDDDLVQRDAAARALAAADEVVLTLTALVELAWVLRTGYGFARDDVAVAIRALLQREGVICPRWTAEEGLEALDAGADFADGVIAYDGAWQGGAEFLSFDRRAIAALRRRGHAARQP